MWSTSGFEADTLQELVNSTAAYYANSESFKDEKYLVIHSKVGETYVRWDAVDQFNTAVRDKIEELESDAYHEYKENYKCIGEGIYRERNVWGE